MQENVLLKLYSNVMDRYTTQSSFNGAGSVQIQGHTRTQICLLLNPFKWVQSVEYCGLWLNICLTGLKVHLYRAPCGLDAHCCILYYAGLFQVSSEARVECLHM